MTHQTSIVMSTSEANVARRRPRPDDETGMSKRRRRAKGSNPSTTWQQQPRIKSAGARARAYISYAGLADYDVGKGDGLSDEDDNAGGANGKQKKKKKSSASSAVVAAELLDPKLDLHSPEVKFGRLLGGTDQRSRHNAVKMLRQYLRARSDIATGSGLSELDLLKLWKGLWYTLYMADKVPVQDKLSKILAELMWCLSGTEEEDEYAGQLYLQMEEDGEDGEGVFEDVDGDTMEIIEMDDDDEEEDDQRNHQENEDAMQITQDEQEEGDEEKDEGEEGGRRARDMNEAHCRGAHLVSLYLSTFLCTVRREWGNVDKHRVDKFYTAVRLMVGEAYKYMSKRHWNLGIIRLFNDVLYSEGLSFEASGLTNGLRYHLIDICLDELAKANKSSELPLTEATFLDCLEPFFALAQKAEDKSVQKRVMNNVLSKFLDEYSFVSDAAVSKSENVGDAEEAEEENANDLKWLIFDQVHVGTVAKFIFEIASDGDTDERYRKSLYEMHKMYVRRIRAAGRDVDLDRSSEEEEEDECGGEVKAEAGDCCPNNTCSVDKGEKCKKRKDDVCKEAEETTDDGGVDAKIKMKDDEKITTPSVATKPEKEDVKDDVTSSVEKYEPESKKKRKKKKKKGGDKESEKADTEADAPGRPKAAADKEGKPHAATPKGNPSAATKKEDCADGHESETSKAIPAATPEPPTNAKTTPKTKSSSKKKRKKQDDEGETAESTESASPYTASASSTEVKTPTPKMKGNKKQKSPPSVDPRSMHSPDQVVSPPSSSDEAGGERGTAGLLSASKRVSFGTTNHCKSYKASMKAVKSLGKERWDTASRTPDKGILRPKVAGGAGSSGDEDSNRKSSEKKRKKKGGGVGSKSPLGQPSSHKKGKRQVW